MENFANSSGAMRQRFAPRRLAFAVALVSALSGCSQRAPAPAVTPSAPPLVATASIIDLMAGWIDPAADALWDSVATISTKEGIVQRRPQTDAEWQAQRHHALTLIETSNLLMIPGRVVAHAGQALDSPPGPGDYSPEQSLAAIEKEPQMFIAFARLLQQTAHGALQAIDARDADKLLTAGGEIDAACERCHQHFWYPVAPAAAPR